MRWLKMLWPWLAAAVSGVLATLSMPPFNQDWLVWICLTPLVSALWFSGNGRKSNVRRAFLLGWVFGLAHFYTVFHWLTTVTVIGWLALVPYLALYPAIWSLFIGLWLNPVDKIHKDGKPSVLVSWKNLRLSTAAAMVWIACEWVRGTLFSGFGWNALGVALHRKVFLIQSADLAGVAILSFQIVLINMIAVLSIYRLLKEVGRTSIRPHYDFNLSIALIVALFTYGIYRVRNAPETRELSVASIQANIPQYQKWDPAFAQEITARYNLLTQAALGADPDLIVWPEASTPESYFGNRATFDMANSVAERFEGAFLFGSLDFDETGDYNAAVLLEAGQDIEVYRKIHLVPFGEFIPFRKSFPLFAWIAGDLVPSDFISGSEPVVMKVSSSNTRIAPLICFEDTLDRVVRKFIPLNPDLLVNITNDGWFLESAGSRQHLANAVFRCVEFRLPMVRSANTGVTCFIDAHGRITHLLTDEQGSTFTAGTLLGKVQIPVTENTTFFAATGNILPVAGCLIALAIPLFHARNNSKPGTRT